MNDRPAPPERTGSNLGLSLGPVDSDPDNDDDDGSSSSSSSSSSEDEDDQSSGSGSSGSDSSSDSSDSSESSSSRSSSGSSSSSSSSSSDGGDFEDDSDGMAGRGFGSNDDGGGGDGDDESYNSDSHHSEPIRLNPSSPSRARQQAVDPPEFHDEVEAVGADDDDDNNDLATDDDGDGDGDGGRGGEGEEALEDDTVVPGTEALQDAYWDPSSSHNHDHVLGEGDSEDEDEEEAALSGGAEHDADVEGEGGGDDDGSDQGVATVAYEMDDDVERGTSHENASIAPNGIHRDGNADEHPLDDDDDDENGDFPVVMHPRQKPRHEPPVESAAAAAEKGPVEDLEAGQLYQRSLDDDDDDIENPDATYGEDVEEGNLEDFADSKDKDKEEIRAAPTASFSHDDTEAAEEHPKEEMQRRKRKRTYVVVGAVVVVALVAAIVGAVVGSQKGGGSTSAPNPSTQPPTPDGGDTNGSGVANPQLFAMVANASADGGAAILRSGSPQNRAYLSLEPAADQYQPSRWLQRYALRTFYYATNGPTNWINNSGWDANYPDLDECLWYQTMVNGTAQVGTTSLCNQNHVLQALMLIENNVTGTLPPELSLLTGLTRFYVKSLSDGSHGSLKGGIPSTLAALTRLEEFSLINHEFGQPIPDGLFDAWSVAKLVEVSKSNVPGTFPRVANMKALRNLNLEGNQLRGTFPADALSQLTELAVFNVDNNQLSGSLPPASHSLYTSLGRLRVLSAANNSLAGTIPPQIGSIASLKQRLDLGSNAFVGPLPTELNLLTNLQRLVVSFNQLTGPVPDLSSLSKLKQLSLEGNQFVGTLSNATCGVVVANGATASADCDRGAPANGTLFVCPCCTTCCVSVANSVCQTRVR
jgi:hypothetical protein